MQGQIMPFRVKIPPRPEARTYHSRRPHRKSRAGCAKCKQRRVKCDETRPHCRKCQKLGIDCTYEAILPVGCGNLNGVTHFIKHAPCLTAPDASAYSMSLRAVSTSIDDILRVKPGRVVGDGFSNLDTLRHFQDVVTSTVISKFGRELSK
ncbi:hypothetical protein ARAM_007029 [Aspergillus rambellii]|uniref:Zn(2)-C6 fungal-type domain-containing protein n=1 Tax=Aspergillus rambellii TaxID=308745 RepID=A0A0F8VHE6_9EURO|nr:hypothetical protein ARAM_007029 [Aspergillus rambellii]